jgi:hypothetical protein
MLDAITAFGFPDSAKARVSNYQFTNLGDKI